MCRNVFVFGCLLQLSVLTNVEGFSNAAADKCELSVNGQALRQCGDDFVDANLCFVCDCCFQSSLTSTPSCYIPPGMPVDFEVSANCSRSLKLLLGKVYFLNNGPVEPNHPALFLVLLEQYSPYLQVYLKTFGGTTVEQKLSQFSKNTTDLPITIHNQIQYLVEENGIDFYVSSSKVVYRTVGEYHAMLTIQSGDGLDGVTAENRIIVTASPEASFQRVLRTAVFLNRSPCTVHQKCFLAAVLTDINEDLELMVNFGDDSNIIKKGSLSFILGGFLEKRGYSCIFAHQYRTAGEYHAKAILIAKLPATVQNQVNLITKVRIKCSIPRISISEHKPLKTRPAKRTMDETLFFQIETFQDCSLLPVAVDWSLSLVNKTNDQVIRNVLADIAEGNIVEIKIQPFILDHGLYSLNIKVKIPYHNIKKYLLVTEVSWFEIVSSPIIAVIEGPLVAGVSDTVRFSSSNSYDPESKSSHLTYTWFCLPGAWNVTELEQMINHSFTGFTGCFYTRCSCTMLEVFGSISSVAWPKDDFYRKPIPATYTVALHVKSPRGTAVALQHLILYAADNATSVIRPTIPLHLLQEVPDIDIMCLSNCLHHLEHSEPLILYSYCKNCLQGELFTYEWTFYPASPNCSLKNIKWDNETLTGNRKAYLIVKEETFGRVVNDDSYQFTVTVTRQSGKQGRAVYSLYFARYNLAPVIEASQQNMSIQLRRHLLHETLLTVFLLIRTFCFN